jgi:hypothetical protein
VEVGGQFRIGEASSAAWLLSRRVCGFGVVAWAVYLVCLFAGVIVVAAVADALLPRWAGPLAIATMGLLGVRTMLIWRRRRSARAWRERGVPDPQLVTFRIEEDALVVEQAMSTSTFRWAGVSELMPTKTHWVYVGPGLGYCLPRRFFGDKAQEQAFLRASLARMNDAARARSKEATAFIGIWE